MDFLVDKEYIEVEVGWYNELVRTKAKWDLLIDNIIHANYKDFETEEVNNWINTYYSKIGIKPKEKNCGYRLLHRRIHNKKTTQNYRRRGAINVFTYIS